MNFDETKTLPRAVDYAAMVRNLFIKELGGVDGQRMHAAIGISGECAEILNALLLNDEENEVEECGDAFFYFQALLNMNNLTVDELLSMPTTLKLASNHSYCDSFGYHLIVASGDLLDLAKKSWVYGKVFDTVKFKQAMANWLIAFVNYITPNDLLLEDIMAHNQYKLVAGPTARYKTGHYTDRQAIARADKVGEE